VVLTEPFVLCFDARLRVVPLQRFFNQPHMGIFKGLVRMVRPRVISHLFQVINVRQRLTGIRSEKVTDDSQFLITLFEPQLGIVSNLFQ
jgi:hypothetical protein